MCFLLNIFRKKKKVPKYVPVNNYDSWEETEKIIFKSINEQRVFHGFSLVEPDENLRNSAEKRAIFLAQKNQGISHDGWTMIAKKLKEQGLRSPGEILGYGYKGGYSVVDAWMRSPGHRKIILSHRTLIGVGFARKGNKTYFVCHFGR